MDKESNHKKQDPSFWEFEAPHYFDFSNMETGDNAENDSYFLNDHEKENLNLIEEEFLSLDESSELLDEYFSPECKHYSFRKTPLRVLHQSGGTPFKEPRVSVVFGKRKSTNTKRVTNAFDFTSIEKALDNCEKTIDNQTTDKEPETISEETFNEIIDHNLENDESLPVNKSNRLSYVVKSPAVVNKPSVHFNLSTLPDAIPDDNVTPVANEKNYKVKNRQPTPGRVERIQKYIKRFSGTSNKQDNKKMAEHNKENTIKEEMAPKCEIVKEELKAKHLNKRISKVKVPPLRPQSVARFNRSTVQRSEVRFVSLAEFSNNFCNSVRKYEPTIAHLKNKITKPKSPKLWTSKRVHNNCPKPATINNKEELNNVNKPKPTKTAATTTANKNYQSRLYLNPKTKLPFNKKKSLTKAQTPIFCTDIRSKIYKSKHDDKDSKMEEPKTTFHARPMPNFKKIHARAEEHQKKPRVSIKI